MCVWIAKPEHLLKPKSKRRCFDTWECSKTKSRQTKAKAFEKAGGGEVKRCKSIVQPPKLAGLGQAGNPTKFTKFEYL